MIEVLTPRSLDQLDQVRTLMRSFVAWHRDRHVEDLRLIDEYFDAAAFEEELARLPGEYAEPDGAILVAYSGSDPAGCVALRGLDGQACEMKRLFVYPRFQGKDIGRALGESIVRRAKALGYAAMRLDTSIRQNEALALYDWLGFRRIEPYYELPPALRDWLVFMELPL